MLAPKAYRRKPVEITAIQWTGLNAQEVGFFIGSADRDELNRFTIPTLEGIMKANVGDFIIKEVAGEFYPCKPEIFKETYEEI